MAVDAQWIPRLTIPWKICTCAVPFQVHSAWMATPCPRDDSVNTLPCSAQSVYDHSFEGDSVMTGTPMPAGGTFDEMRIARAVSTGGLVKSVQAGAADRLQVYCPSFETRQENPQSLHHQPPNRLRAHRDIPHRLSVSRHRPQSHRRPLLSAHRGW